jgi:DNA repair exonuclease SbcCD ATPase subunit
MKLFIKKFKTIENLEVQIPSQINGGNGLGKSTILEAISFVLTGKDLNGSEFKQVYDNRQDLHDAIADVSFFDNYNNEFQRIVQPIFQTNRAGIEEIKIKRSTECRKNGIVCNDFSDDFVDFYKFGTDYFFNQKEDVQRSIFIDILKSKLPDYDVNAASLKLKELKKSQKIEVDNVKSLQDAQKNTKDVEVPTMPLGLIAKNSEYNALLNAANPEAVQIINKRNNDAYMAYFAAKTNIQNDVVRCELAIERIKNSIDTQKTQLEAVKSLVFVHKQLEDTTELQHSISMLNAKLQSLEYFESLEHYAQENFAKNPVLVENQIKIKELMSTGFVPMVDDNSNNCPLSGTFCETAKLHSEKAQMIKFDTRINEQITALKSQNRQIIEKEMQSINSEYNAVKSDLQEAERKLNNIIESNKKVDADNALMLMAFESTKKTNIDTIESDINALDEKHKGLIVELSRKQVDLQQLKEPTPEKLPEQVEISEELKEASEKYKALQVEINKAEGVNENNAKLIAERAIEIKAKQSNLLQIGSDIATLTAEISDYFSNLSQIVKTEFAGDINIDVELLEYVMSKDEYKDTFKITANGKVFPYECNGALQNNTKLQILFNLQRLKGYTGVTIMDNCEANTTQKINTLGLNCVIAFATLENELKIN